MKSAKSKGQLYFWTRQAGGPITVIYTLRLGDSDNIFLKCNLLQIKIEKVEMWWLIDGDVVAHWFRCGGSFVDMWWLIG